MRRALSVGLLIQSAAWCAAPAGVLAVRYSTLEGSTRIVIETDVEVRYRSEALHEPERLFFDLAGATPRFGEKGLRTISVDDPRVKRIRVAQTLPGTTRVVLDLETAVEVTTARASNPARIVIELRPKAPAPPLAVEVAATVVEPPPPPPPVAEAARRTSTGGSSMIRALGLKIGRVVLDPGHGGYDQGSAGPGGLLEKDLVLDVARRLGELIEQRMGSEVVYTRDDDTFVALEARAALANEKKADLFLSIHANSSPYASVAGVETYYLNFTTARDALDVAARENAGSTRTVHELAEIVEKITQHDKVAESREFAGKMQAALYTAARTNPLARNRGVKKAPFAVLIGATMPSILAEIGFVSNRKEEDLLRKGDHRQRLAEALFRGITRYAESLSHFRVAQVKDSSP